jgi:hypothetical protein
MSSRRLVGAASTLLLVILLRAAGAEMPAPGTVITAENLERYRDALFPTAEYFLRHGMTITVIPYRRWEWTVLYKEATEKFASQVRLSADGRDLQNYVAGAPFPVIDTANDPLAAYKWIWNHEQPPRRELSLSQPLCPSRHAVPARVLFAALTIAREL